MIGSVARLAVRRLRGRAGSTILLAVAIAAATGVVGTIAGIATVASDRGIANRLATLTDGERAIRISSYEPSGRFSVELDAAARTALVESRGFTTEPVGGIVVRRVTDPNVPVDLQIVALDDAARWVTLLEGRLPGRCDGRACEAILLSEIARGDVIPDQVTIAGLPVTVVGRGLVTSPVPLTDIDQSGTSVLPADPYETELSPPPALLLVDGVMPIAIAPALAEISRTQLWTAPLVADAIHPWTVSNLRGVVASTQRSLALAGLRQSMASPLTAIDAELARAAAADGRLLLVGSLGVAVLVAFVAFAAVVGRRDIRAELDRLASAGAGRAARLVLLLVEALVPSVAGAVVGWLGAAGTVGALAAWQGRDPVAVVGVALLQPEALAVAAVVAAMSALVVIVGAVANPSRSVFIGLTPGLLLAGGLLAWQVFAGGPLGASQLAATVSGPLLALLPAAVAFAIAAAALAMLPAIFRALARRTARSPLPVRLALLSVARDPGRPAVTLTVLAFSLGALVFAAAYAATLRSGIADQAAYAAGLDLRVAEAGTGLTLSSTVIPFERYGSLGPDAEAFPALRRPFTATPGGEITVLGLDPDAVAGLRGWRSDFGSESPAELASRIRVEGDFHLPGHDLPADARDLEIPLTVEGPAVRLEAVVQTKSGDFAHLGLGFVSPGRAVLREPLPVEAIGGRLVALIAADQEIIAGENHPGQFGRPRLTFEGLDGLVEAQPIEIDLVGVQQAVIRPPYPTDDLVLPAIVGRRVAAVASDAPDQTIAISLGRTTIRLMPVAVADHFPTVARGSDAFAIVDLAPLSLALNAGAPGIGRPDEAWIRTADAATATRVTEALSRAPFRSATVVSRPDAEAAEAADPFAAAVVWALLAAALAGLALAGLSLVLGAVADLRDETGELRDLEAQGLGPAALRRQAGARSVALAAGGVIAGVVVGIALVALATGTIGLSAGAAAPVPPLVVVVPWAIVIGAAAIPLGLAAVLVRIAAGRTFAAESARGSR